MTVDVTLGLEGKDIKSTPEEKILTLPAVTDGCKALKFLLHHNLFLTLFLTILTLKYKINIKTSLTA